MQIDRRKFMALALTMSAAPALANCIVVPPPDQPGGQGAQGAGQPIENTSAPQSQPQASPPGGGNVYTPAPADECVQWSPSGECTGWASDMAAPADECVQWSPSGECTGWASDMAAPVDECVQWSPSGECIGWQ